MVLVVLPCCLYSLNMSCLRVVAPELKERVVAGRSLQQAAYRVVQ